MTSCWVIAADGAQARFMELQHHAAVPARAEYRLVESTRMSNPDHTVKGRRDARKIKSGRDTGHGALAPHGYADHRDSHDAELLRRFAADIAGQAAALVSAQKASSLVLVADPRMLGLLRIALEPLTKAGIPVKEHGHDYGWCSAQRIYELLADNGLLPASR
jgi:protein required for attachment to host cells